MARFKQKVIPSVISRHSTSYKQTVSERYSTLQHCKQNYITNEQTGIKIEFISKGRSETRKDANRKIAAIIPVLPELLKYAELSNCKRADPTDPPSWLFFYNFKAYVYIDGSLVQLRIPVVCRVINKGGATGRSFFHYTCRVNKIVAK